MRAFAALLAVLVVPVVAAAQETGTLRPIAPATAEGTGKAEVRDVLRQFARCALKKSPGFVAKLLDAPAGSPDYERWIRRVSDGECLGFSGTLKMGVADMRGALFEASYMHNYGHDAPVNFASVAPIDYATRFGQPGNRTADRTVALAEFADCVTRADGGDAQALIISTPGSTAETASIASLRPHLTKCVEQGHGMGFDRGAFRAAIAEGLYRLTQAATATPATAAGKS